MIYQMARDLEANLRALKYPVHVLYEPGRMTREHSRPLLITIERDRSRGDSIGTGHSRGVVRSRLLGVTARVFARSSVAGSRVEDHERLCDQVVDALVIAIVDWGTAARAGDIQFSAARYLTPAEYDGAEMGAGLVYQLSFGVSRAMRRVDFDGDGALTAELLDVSTTFGDVS